MATSSNPQAFATPVQSESKRRIPSWTAVMKDHFSHNTKIPPETLMLRDKEFGWTLFHAMVSIKGVDLKRRRHTFRKFLKIRVNGNSLSQLLMIADDDGDTVFHSVVNHRRTGAKGVLEMMIKMIQSPTVKRTLLATKNKRHFTPLKRAFQMREWELVRILLKECIQIGILPELTGIQRNPIDTGYTNTTKTLLHRAFSIADAAASYLKLHLIICTQCRLTTSEIIRSLSITNKGGLTPWFYLIDTQKDAVIKDVITVLKEFNIDINSLYTDAESESNLLQLVWKQNREGLADFLKGLGVDPVQRNRRGLRPLNRYKSVSLDDQQTTDDTSSCSSSFSDDEGSYEELMDITTPECSADIPARHTVSGMPLPAILYNSPESGRRMAIIP